MHQCCVHNLYLLPPASQENSFFKFEVVKSLNWPFFSMVLISWFGLFKLIAVTDCSKINQLIILTITAISLNTSHWLSRKFLMNPQGTCQESLEGDSYQNRKWLMVWLRHFSQGGVRKRSTSLFLLFSPPRYDVSTSSYRKWILNIKPQSPLTAQLPTLLSTLTPFLLFDPTGQTVK